MACSCPPAAGCSAALTAALAEEREPQARRHLKSVWKRRLGGGRQGTGLRRLGFPLFITAGSRTAIQGGFGTLWAAAASHAAAPQRIFPAANHGDPLTRTNPGDNVGPGMPKVELRFDGDGDGLEIIAVPKGGGSEIFGTFYRMLYPSDGREGIVKFVLDAIRDGCYAGKICPPAIVGVGLGGTADLCMRLAKEAAVLRPLGSRNPDSVLAALEGELLAAARDMGLGPMGARGINAVIGLHIAVAVTHTAALPVAVNAQCMVGRRWKAMLKGDGSAEYTGIFT